jgi:hypothetical protein
LPNVDKKLSDTGTDHSFIVISDDMLLSVIGLKHSKNDSECEINSDGFIHACNQLFILLAMLITFMINHSFLINNLKFSAIKPIPSNKCNLGKLSNYESIAVSSVLGKITEQTLLDQ